MPPHNSRSQRSMSRRRSVSGSRGSRSRSPSRTSSRGQQTPGPEMVLPSRPKNNITPQAAIDEFWDKFTSKKPGKATAVIPKTQFVKTLFKSSVTISSTGGTSSLAQEKPPSAEDLIAYAQPVHASYEAAATLCRAKVDKIIKECRRVNKRYRDAHFDIEADLKMGIRDCLESLSNAKDGGPPPGASFNPRGVQRVTDIFDDPKFYIDGPTANDVRQGKDSGDCWLMSALCTLSNKQGLIEKLCVAHDQDVGVYGFVFHRDGEWFSEIVDDFLYLTKSDYDEALYDRVLFDELERVNAEELYRKVYQSNSGALYFAQCSHQQETWLPLLEKGYAKAHGDYAAIEGGFGGEGIEDLTGGITSEIFTTDILDKELFWKELLSANKEFLFSCGTGVWGSKWGDRTGIIELHSYSVQKAVEIEGKRLVRLKNPWGKGEWKGPWSDGSKEWTPEWLQKLGHRFGDDGDFWIEYKDLLRKYQTFERTRLFEGDWKFAQIWTTLNIPWMIAYHDTYFSFKVATPGRVVIVLTQLDSRYFRGLQGQYSFRLSFRVHKAGREGYLVRSQLHQRLRRSVSVELDLEEGEYDVRVKFDTIRDHSRLPIEDVVMLNAKNNCDKLSSIGLAYDLAHGKGLVVETAEEKAAKEAYERKLAAKSKDELKKKLLGEMEEAYYMKSKRFERNKAREVKRRAKRREKIAGRKAALKAKREAVAKEEGGLVRKEDLLVSSPEGMEKREMVKDKVAAEIEGDAAGRPGFNVPDEAETLQDEAKANKEKPREEVNPQDEKKPHEEVKPEAEANLQSKDEAKPEEEVKTTDHSIPDNEAVTNNNDKAGPFPHTCESESDSNDDDLESLDSMSVYSDRELDIRAADLLASRSPKEPQPKADEPDGETDPFESDPWNAVAVVGLGVYHQPTDGKSTDRNVVTLRVVRPSRYADGDATQGERAESKTQGLDVDDSAKDATMTGEVSDRKKSIMGDKRPL